MGDESWQESPGYRYMHQDRRELSSINIGRFSTNKVKEINVAANKRALIPDNSLRFNSCVKSLERDIKEAAEEKKQKALKTM